MSKPEYIDPVVFNKFLKEEMMKKTLTDLINPPPIRSAPPWSFISDPDVGYYKMGADKLNFVAGGKVVATIEK